MTRLPKKKLREKQWRKRTGKKYRYPHKPSPPRTSYPIYSKVCPITNKLFTARTRHAKYSAEGREIRISQYHAEHYVPVIRESVSFICAECGVSCSSDTRTRYCSIRCANRVRRRKDKALRRSRIANTTTDNISVHVVLLKYGYQCASCGCDTPIEHRGTYLPTAPELDHIIPLSKGGTHTYNNIQLLCRQCNGTKSDNVIDALQ